MVVKTEETQSACGSCRAEMKSKGISLIETDMFLVTLLKISGTTIAVRKG